MELQRLILFVAIGFVSLMLWNAWQQDYMAQTKKNAVLQSPANTASAPEETQASEMPAQSSDTSLIAAKTQPSETINVTTDAVNVKISEIGGNVVYSALPKYPQSLKQKNDPVVLMNAAPETFYVAQSILANANNMAQSDANLKYKTTQKSFNLAPGKQSLDVVLEGEIAPGILVKKIYTFSKGSNLILLNYQIENQTDKPWEGKLYTELLRKDFSTNGSGFFQIHPYTGAAISTPDKRYQEVSFKDMRNTNINKVAQGGWAAMVQHYFLSAWIPSNQTQNNNFYTKVSDDDVYTLGFSTPRITVPANSTQNVSAKLYTGPEVASTLKKIAPGLDLTVSYGWLWFISVIIFWIMEKIYFVVGNWGWSIILVTILIKLLFYHLSAKSYKSMAKMRELQPRIEALKEKYGDDRQKMSQAMMELYKKEKVNPLGGCLPILVQIPVFFALYMVLIESVQLRQAPWILWIQDLSQPDPYYVLPILMGITMFIQQKISPPPPDPTQAKVMLFLPVIFTVLFVNFPAGLVLYWVVNNALSILQQWYVTRKYQQSHAPKDK